MADFMYCYIACSHTDTSQFLFPFRDIVYCLNIMYDFFINQQYCGYFLVINFQKIKFIEVTENISEVENKIQFALLEKANMNINVYLIYVVISEVTLLTVIEATLVIYHVYKDAREPNCIIVLQTIVYVLDICNILICFEFINLVFIVKKRYSRLNKCLSNWINGTVIYQYASNLIGLLIT
jgi:hypothetical protein